MTTDMHEVPKHLPPLPEGAAYLGRGPIPTPDRGIRNEEIFTVRHDQHCGFSHCFQWESCQAVMADMGVPDDPEFVGGSRLWHYAAPLESDITRHILAHRVPDGVPVLPEGYVFAGKLGDYSGDFHGAALDMSEPEEGWYVDEEWLGMKGKSDLNSYNWPCATKIDSPLARKLLGLDPDTRPSWEDAPEWAEWLAQDSDGTWNWYRGGMESDPYPGPYQWEYDSGPMRCYGENHRVAGQGEPSPNWRETLEPRPAQEGHGTTREVSKLTLKIDASEVERAIKQALDKIEVWADECRLGYVAPDTHEELLGLFPDFKGHPEGWREVTEDELTGVRCHWGGPPDLVITDTILAHIPADAEQAIARAARLEGYRIEWDSDGIRGWKGD